MFLVGLVVVPRAGDLVCAEAKRLKVRVRSAQQLTPHFMAGPRWSELPGLYVRAEKLETKYLWEAGALGPHGRSRKTLVQASSARLQGEQAWSFQFCYISAEVSAMSRIVRCALIQARNVLGPEHSLNEIREAMLRKHVDLIEQAAREQVQILCLQELFYGPYFCAEQDARWYELAEPVPDGPIIRQMQELAARHQMTMVVPVYEQELPGLYFNTAAVLDADGRYLGKYRKHHIPHCHPGFWEKFYFTPGDLGYPVFDTKYAKIGVYICYDRHFPEGARALGLNGAEILFNPSATVAGLSEYLWELEQPAHAVANGYFVGAINRVGDEKPWSIGEFYGKSYFCNPRGKIVAQASRDKDEVLVQDLDLDMILEVRKVWQFFRDRRPESYGVLTKQSGKAHAAD